MASHIIFYHFIFNDEASSELFARVIKTGSSKEKEKGFFFASFFAC